MIAVDWGLRVSAILESRTATKGILSIEAGPFPGTLEEQVGDWIAAGEAPVVMSGMVGSRQGGPKSHLWGGWATERAGSRFFFSGDTAYSQDFS